MRPFFKTQPGLLLSVIVVLLPGILVVGARIENPAVLLATDALLLPLAWGPLYLRGNRWSELGFQRPSCLKKLIGVVLVTTLVLIIISSMLRPVVFHLTGEKSDLEVFKQIEGNFTALLIGLLIVWTIAAFIEELVFRGFLLNAIQKLAPDKMGKKNRWTIALLISSAIFGLAHTYQGIYGMVMTGIMGLGFGAIYLMNHRNLWYSILTHGLYDTTGFVLIYFGINPNLESINIVFLIGIPIPFSGFVQG